MSAVSDPPLDILLVFRAPVGGLFRNVRDVTEELAARGHRLGILCDSTTGGERGREVLASLAPLLVHGVHRLPMHRNPHPSDIAALRRVAALVSEKGIGVVHGHGAKGGFYARFAGVLAPNSGPIRCYTPHGGSLNYYPGSLAHKGFMLIERLLERGTDLFLFESRFIAARYREFVCASRRPTRIALNGLYAQEFEPVTPDANATDFLYVGEFREAKGIDTLVEALFQLAGCGLHPTITLVGSGPSEARIRALIDARNIADQFRWRGVMPATEAFRLGRVMVVPSRFESLPYIVLEAVAGQLPIITTDVGGIPEIVPTDHRYLIIPDNPARLAGAMADAMSRPFSALKDEAAATSGAIRERFSVERMADTIVEGYREAIRFRRN